MKPAKLLSFVILSFSLCSIISLSSCSKVQGCTNPYSENYNIEAEEDDGSCILFRDKFIGQYSVTQECLFNSFDMSIVAFCDENEILINNFGSFEAPVHATVINSSFTIHPQDIFTSGITLAIDGIGTISGDNLIITYDFDYNGSSKACEMICTKK